MDEFKCKGSKFMMNSIFNRQPVKLPLNLFHMIKCLLSSYKASSILLNELKFVNKGPGYSIKGRI